MDILSKFAPESLTVIIWQDFLARVQAGTYAYIPAWIVVCLYADVYHAEPVFFAVNSLLVLCIAVGRAHFIDYAKQIQIKQISRTKKIVWSIVLMSALHWGLTTTYLLNSSANDQAELKYFLITLLATFASGGASNYNAFGKLGALFSLSIITIPFTVELIKDPENMFAYVVIAFLFLGITNQVSNTTQSYTLAASNHFKLLGMYAKTMEELSKVDFLTKLKSRYQFLIEFEVIWHDSINKNHPIALLYINIDQLHALNDTHGHHCRDACLEAFAKRLKPQFNAPDILSRYGSEEFMLALPNKDLASAEQVAQNIVDGVREMSFVYNDTSIPLTCSIGLVTTNPALVSDPEHFIMAADTQLLLAKDHGKNGYQSAHVNT